MSKVLAVFAEVAEENFYWFGFNGLQGGKSAPGGEKAGGDPSTALRTSKPLPYTSKKREGAPQ